MSSIDTTTEPGTSLALRYTDDQELDALSLVEELSVRLEERTEAIEECRDYYDGRHRIGFATKKWRETFGREFGEVINNWCKKAVNTRTQRMNVLGFRFGVDQDDQPAGADEKAWEFWRRNQLHLRSKIVHRDAVSTGYSAVMVWPSETDTSFPIITVEDPLQTTVLTDPQNMQERIAGLKRWRDLDGLWNAYLFTPDEVWTLEGGKGSEPKDWKVVDYAGNPIGRVPIVEFVNDPDVYGEGTSVLTDLIPLNDMVNKTLADAMIASEFAAFPQRVLIGVEVPTDDEGNPDHSMVGGINRWLAFEGETDEDGKTLGTPSIQELEAANLENYTKMIDQLITHMGALACIPPQQLLGGLKNVGGDAMTAAESGQVSAVKDAIAWFGASWEEVQRLAFAIYGDTERASSWMAETIWDNPEITSDAELADAATKRKSIGVPDEALWEYIGATPAQIRTWRKQRQEQALLDGMAFGGSAPDDGVAPELTGIA
jgi:hypothetical protein